MTGCRLVLVVIATKRVPLLLLAHMLYTCLDTFMNYELLNNAKEVGMTYQKMNGSVVVMTFLYKANDAWKNSGN